MVVLGSRTAGIWQPCAYPIRRVSLVPGHDERGWPMSCCLFSKCELENGTMEFEDPHQGSSLRHQPWFLLWRSSSCLVESSRRVVRLSASSGEKEDKPVSDAWANDALVAAEVAPHFALQGSGSTDSGAELFLRLLATCEICTHATISL